MIPYGTPCTCFFFKFHISFFKYLGRNVIFLKDSCQIITPVSPKELPKNAKESNYGLSVPGNITAYLQVVDLMSSRLRYIPVPG